MNEKDKVWYADRPGQKIVRGCLMVYIRIKFGCTPYALWVVG